MANTTDRVRWGVMGRARIARGVFNGAVSASSNGRLYAIASRDARDAAEWQNEFGFEVAYGSYEELLADSAVEAIYIPLPNALHLEWAIKAIAAGKHVLCEKPITVDADQCRRLIDALRGTGLAFMENFAFRCHPLHAQLRETIDSGAIGDLQGLHITIQNVVDDPNSVLIDRALAGGARLDAGCYAIAFSRFVFGSEPISVVAVADRRAGTEVDHTFSGVLHFEGGRYALVQTSLEMLGGQFARIFGTEAEIVLPAPCHPRIQAHDFVIRRDLPSGQPRVRRTADEVVSAPVIEPFRAAVEHFSACVREGTAPIVSLQDSLNNMIVLDACHISAREGRRVDLAGQRRDSALSAGGAG